MSNDLLAVASSLSGTLGRPVDVVTSPDSLDVAPYRMKKVRNHFVSSQLKHEMIQAGENWVVAVSLKVVIRALSGCHPVLSVLLSPE